VVKACAVISENFKGSKSGPPPSDLRAHLPSLMVLRAALESALERYELLSGDRREHALAALALVDAACSGPTTSPAILRRHLRHATRHLKLMAGPPTSLEWDEACAAARRAMTATFFELGNLPN
jgi:hypothetical protein